jgi:hypothetical protein
MIDLSFPLLTLVLFMQENVKAPAFKFPIYVKNIQKGKHGSDTDAYDTHGRYRYY